MSARPPARPPARPGVHRILAEYMGGAVTCDAHHMTDPRADGLGVSTCIELALKDARIGKDQINYINAHATRCGKGRVDCITLHAWRPRAGPRALSMRYTDAYVCATWCGGRMHACPPACLSHPAVSMRARPCARQRMQAPAHMPRAFAPFRATLTTPPVPAAPCLSFPCMDSLMHYIILHVTAPHVHWMPLGAGNTACAPAPPSCACRICPSMRIHSTLVGDIAEVKAIKKVGFLCPKPKP